MGVIIQLLSTMDIPAQGEMKQFDVARMFLHRWVEITNFSHDGSIGYTYIDPIDQPFM